MTWRERLFGIRQLDDGVRLVRLEASAVRDLVALKDVLGVSVPEAAALAIKESLDTHGRTSVSDSDSPTDNA